MTEQVEILLVEDDPHDLELALRALRKQRFANSAHAVIDGQAALDFLLARGEYADRTNAPPPKVVFLSLHLPKVDGIDVLRKLKENERTRGIPVVVMTSSVEERERVVRSDLGAHSYVVKPIDFDSFARTMADLGFRWLTLNPPPQ